MVLKLDNMDLSLPANRAEYQQASQLLGGHVNMSLVTGVLRNIDLRIILQISITDKRNLVELQIPGSSGNVLQDMGADPVSISLEGEIAGLRASEVMQELMTKYEAGKPVSFYSDLTAIADVSQVLIENLKAKQQVGSISKYHYTMQLRESREL